MKKKQKKILRIILKIFLVIVLCVITGILTYHITLKIDQGRYKGNVDVTITLDDSKTYVIPSVDMMSKEDALKEWPYIFQVENKGDAKGLYRIYLQDVQRTIDKDKLDYVLMLDGEEMISGNLSSLKDDILYTSSIDKEQIQKYQLYIWVNSEQEVIPDVDYVYEYQLNFEIIKDGGPGF